ncbi:MAG: hypothetical protein JO264_03610 [Acidisphaera sp.]|nr:hypothetical protein [Acidisphaera sp.]
MSDNSSRSAGPGAAGVIAILRDAFAILREAAIVGVILFFMLDPTAVGTFLAQRGVHDVDVMGVHVALDQFNQVKDALNAVSQQSQSDEAAGAAAADNPAEAALTDVLASIGTALHQADPSLIPRQGWVLLGTLEPGADELRPGPARKVDEPYAAIKPGETLVLRASARLVADTEPHWQAKVLSALPAGAHVTIRALDRTHVQGAQGRPVFDRLWAKVDVS